MPPPPSPWRTLVPELIHHTSLKILTVLDFVRFRAVCKSWRSSTSPGDLPQRFPLLLLPYHRDSEDLSLFCPATRSVYHLHLPLTHGKDVHGSGHGWLILLEQDSSAPTLLNPLSASHISLSPSGFLGRNMLEATLSSNPTLFGCIVAISAFHSTEIVFCQLSAAGWSEWTAIDLGIRVNEILFYQRKLYVNSGPMGELGICEIETGEETCVFHTLLPSDQVDYRLVEAFGELLLIAILGYMYIPNPSYIKDNYVVYKWDESHEPMWVRAKSIGDRVIFLSENNSITTCASQFLGCKERMYVATFGPDYDGYNYDANVDEVNLKNGDIKQWHSKGYPREFKWPKRWLVPSLI